MSVLSIQSSVAYGHVGNSAAVFPLQRMGVEVWPVATVQFSSHAGHAGWRGRAFPAEHVGEVVEGLAALGVLAGCRAVLSGYLGTPQTGRQVLAAVRRVKAARPDAFWCCDPVMGDDGKGLFVAAGIPEFLAGEALAAADLVTPNHFELETLAGGPANNLAEAVAAARSLCRRGPSMVVVTSLRAAGLPPGEAANLAVTAAGAWLVRTPLLDFPRPPCGAGDLLAALLTGRLLEGKPLAEALGLAVSSLFGVLARTLRDGGDELALVAAQDEFVSPSHRFVPVAVGA